MSIGDGDELDTVTERAALIGYLIGRGYTFTAGEVADFCNMGERGARKLLERCSRRAVPMYQDEKWVWRGAHGEEHSVPPSVLR